MGEKARREESLVYFENLQALLYMDGHGGFVWTAYGVTLVAITWLISVPRRRQRRILKQLADELRRTQGVDSPGGG